jgi:hypothetical protein
MKPLAILAGLVVAVTTAADPLIWRLSETTQVGGQVVTVLGAPRIAHENGGPAMVFNGSSDGIFIPVNPLAGCPAFTVEVLFKPEEGGLAAQRFFHLQDAKTWRIMIETRVDGRGQWWLDTFLGATGVSQALIDSARTHPTGRWYWVALRFDGKRMTSFVDGVQELEREAAFGPMVEGQLSLGVRQNKVHWFKGAIREVRWHKRAVAETELQRP